MNFYLSIILELHQQTANTYPMHPHNFSQLRLYYPYA